MTSEKKLAANRRNALKSTGPRTGEGKARVRYNALTHGILSNEAIITRYDSEDDVRAFALLCQDLQDELQPVGVLEQQLVNQIASCWWRLRRAERAERGAINRERDIVAHDLDTRAKEHAGQLILQIAAPTAAGDEVPAEIRAYKAMQELASFVAGLNTLIGMLDGQITIFRDPARPPSTTFDGLALAFSMWSSPLKQALRPFSPRIGPKKLDINVVREKDPVSFTWLVETMEQVRANLDRKRAQLVAREALDREARADLAALPDDATTHKILRYQTAVNNQLHRALAELERLQQRRVARTVEQTGSTRAQADPPRLGEEV